MNAHDMNLKIADNMEKYGGSFVQALAVCVKRADSRNLVKLRECFPEYFNQYHPSNWVRKERDERTNA